jgi:hypothetical protein
MQVSLLTGNNREERGLFRRPPNPTLHVCETAPNIDPTESNSINRL